jgi:hypothetical protein
MNRVLADRDAVVVVELLLLDRFSVDQRAVRASQVNDPELLAPTLDPGVVPAGRRIAKDEVVVRRTPHPQRALCGAIGVPRVGS